VFEFEPRLAIASLSGEADAEWARAAADYAGLAVLGGIAIDPPTRRAARAMAADRDRTEFLPTDPLAFVDAELAALGDAALRPAVNVRAVDPDALREVGAVCADRGAPIEINAHCRQAEMCAAGAGETLLRDVERLRKQVAAAAETGATVSVKARTEVEGADVPAVARAASAAGADVFHLDAMDSEPVVADAVAAFDGFLIANNGVRDRETAFEYLEYGADAVSVGRPSDDPAVLARVRDAVREWFR
jgi:TIM-barrel protein